MYMSGLGHSRPLTDLRQNDPPSPPKRPIVHAPRKDADPHFQFTDESSPAPEKAIEKTKSLQRQKGMGLYQNIMSEDQGSTPKSSRNNTTSSDNNRRDNDFGAHYSMTDVQNEDTAPSKHAARGSMTQHWSFDTPPTEKKLYKTGRRRHGRAQNRYGRVVHGASETVRDTRANFDNTHQAYLLILNRE